jgi:hypothetical protein
MQDLYFYENSQAAGELWAGIKTIRGVSEGKMIRYDLKRQEPLKAEIQAFLNAVKNGTRVPVTGEDGLQALRLSLAWWNQDEASGNRGIVIMSIEDLHRRINDHSAKVAVIVWAMSACPWRPCSPKRLYRDRYRRQSRTYRFNQSGHPPIEGKEPGLGELISGVVKSGKLHATSNYDELKDVDLVMIDVETPVNHAHIPEYEALGRR